ncbi:50S ribosomal protein L11 [Candidatus Marsarchaeota G1 archaeon OSP_D]|jgi:large subunit ribosomal protein L11|uniref:Large ribosomal subunit protein uL11 n=4 Tax=Candidatus Marsarchaeota group 1 TaxID=2203770 RepID=A0A2R6AJQ8_9ARCH|nr:MAG: 50S ribosomal protein L11 [Candidatus Marsarchaeota G1 archaeon OSP_D]PSN86597.1 MAG: 50S ribosomal protein L11 [Candidatus Marsarchaeota G1 archaeon BE_D]PSN89650.1 MAG: 50S ribosomal protein L11 [Candidatus Marsarchaeota G1 archaeon OSP_C]
MGKVRTFKFLVPAGKASPGPPIGPALGPTGARTPQVVQKINELTKKYEGMSVNVLVHIDLETKEFNVEVLPPSVSSLLLKKVGAEKGPATPHTTKVGDVNFSYIVELAKQNIDRMNTTSLKSAVKSILGTCRSIGITVEGKDPKEILAKVESGEFKELIGE